MATDLDQLIEAIESIHAFAMIVKDGGLPDTVSVRPRLGRIPGFEPKASTTTPIVDLKDQVEDLQWFGLKQASSASRDRVIRTTNMQYKYRDLSEEHQSMLEEIQEIIEIFDEANQVDLDYVAKKTELGHRLRTM